MVLVGSSASAAVAIVSVATAMSASAEQKKISDCFYRLVRSPESIVTRAEREDQYGLCGQNQWSAKRRVDVDGGT
jgi:hypothetical protein